VKFTSSHYVRAAAEYLTVRGFPVLAEQCRDVADQRDKLHRLAINISVALDGSEWSADTLAEVAELLAAAGFTVNEPRG